MAELTRRRFIAIAACAAATLPAAARAAEVPRVRWLGKALGAKAEIVLEHPDRAVAQEALAEALTEIERLEAVLSLYRTDSALARLNLDGNLQAPPADLVRVLAEARHVSELSDGAFDVTVQPLWALYADTIRKTGREPAPEDIARVRALVDWRGVEASPQSVAFARPGMAATLNGIGQGYVTDRVAELLRRRGFANVLVDLGEPRVLGPRADGSPWPVSIRDPMLKGVALHRFGISDGAMATTEAQGSSFPGFGKYGHLLDPKTGRAALGVPSVTVMAPSASLADALSTAIAVAGPDRAPAILAAAGTRAILVDARNTLTTL